MLELPPKVRRQTARLVHDQRRTVGRPVLTDAEETRLDIRRDQQTGTTRNLQAEARRTHRQWQHTARRVATGLTQASVTTPPQRPDRTGIRAGIPDPVAAAVDATLHHIEQATDRYVHLTSPCLLDGQHDRGDGRCPGPHTIDLGQHPRIRLDADRWCDQLLAPTPGTVRWQHAAYELADWHNHTARQMLDLWQQAHRGALDPQLAETSALEAWLADTVRIVRMLQRLAGDLAQWDPPQVCKHDGCGGAAEAGRRECGACRNRHHRARTAG